jgi:hypothetical protein
MTQTTQQSHLLRLWYKPGSSMQGLIAQGQGQRLALVVAACFGAIQLLPWLSAEPSRPWWVLPLAAGLAIAGVCWLAWLLRNFGRWFGAAAHLHELRTALGVALLPWTLVFSLLFVLTQTAPAAESVQAWFPWFLGWLCVRLCHPTAEPARGPTGVGLEDFPVPRDRAGGVDFSLHFARARIGASAPLS